MSCRQEWEKAKIEKNRFVCNCDGCNKVLGTWGEQSGDPSTVSDEPVVQITTQCCKFGSLTRLCMECLNNLHNEAYREGLPGIGGADGL